MPDIKTVGIISKPAPPAAAELVPRLLEWLRAARHRRCACDEETAAYTRAVAGLPRDRCPKAATW